MNEITISLERLPETDEWIVAWRINGRLDEDKTYYTNDREDAALTMENHSLVDAYEQSLRDGSVIMVRDYRKAKRSLTTGELQELETRRRNRADEAARYRTLAEELKAKTN